MAEELRVSGEDDAKALALSGPLTVATVASVRRNLLERLTVGATAACDLRAVDACDTAGIQLLCAAAHTARALGTGWRLLASPAVSAAAQRAGVELASLEVARP